MLIALSDRANTMAHEPMTSSESVYASHRLSGASPVEIDAFLPTVPYEAFGENSEEFENTNVDEIPEGNTEEMSARVRASSTWSNVTPLPPYSEVPPPLLPHLGTHL